MRASLAGIVVFLFLIWCRFTGWDLGATATVILVALGAVLIAAASIDTIKLSTDGLELKTRETKVVNTRITIPRLDLVKIFCWVVIFLSIVIYVYLSLLERPDYGNTTFYDNTVTLAQWATFFSAISILLLIVKAWRARTREPHQPSDSKRQ